MKVVHISLTEIANLLLMLILAHAGDISQVSEFFCFRSVHKSYKFLDFDQKEEGVAYARTWDHRTAVAFSADCAIVA